jgi:hypothetical protein
MAVSREKISRRLNPTSINSRVFSVATQAALPLLPLPNTQTRTLNRPPLCFDMRSTSERINSIIGEAAALEKEKECDSTLAGKLARARADRHNEAVAKALTLW